MPHSDKGFKSIAQTPISEFELLVGKEIGCSEWMTVDRERILSFAAATSDLDEIHFCDSAAARGPFGKVTAQGFLTLSLLTRFASTLDIIPKHKHRINYGFDSVRWIEPISPEDNVRARFRLLSVRKKGCDEFVITVEVTIEADGKERPSVKADWLWLLTQ
jgi:acyl dehydratase